MNTINLIGRLGKDWELKQAQNGKSYAKNSLAVTRAFDRDKTDWFYITAFGKAAEALANYTRKGSQIGIVGRMQIDQYQDNQGNNRTSYDVIINEFNLLDNKNDNQQNSSQGYQQPNHTPGPFANNADPIQIDDDMLPF